MFYSLEVNKGHDQKLFIVSQNHSLDRYNKVVLVPPEPLLRILNYENINFHTNLPLKILK